MTYEEVIETIEKNGFKITKNNFSIKPIYKNHIYFFKRELEQDHIFINNKEQELDNINQIYFIKHNPDNYNPEITTMGKFSDSFCLEIKNIEKRIIKNEDECPVTEDELPIKTRKEDTHEITQTDVIILSIENRLKEITILLEELKK